MIYSRICTTNDRIGTYFRLKRALLPVFVTWCFFQGFCTPLIAFPTATQKKAASNTSVIRNTLFGAASLAATGAGLALPYKTAAHLSHMRTFFLGAMTTQTIGSVAKNIEKKSPSDSKNNSRSTKLAVDVGYALYNLLFVDIARRWPLKTAANIQSFRTYCTFCLLSQGLGTIARDSIAPYCASACEKVITLAHQPCLESDSQLLTLIDPY